MPAKKGIMSCFGILGFFFFLQVGLLKTELFREGMEIKTNNNIQYTSVTPTHSSSSVFMWHVQAIKAGFTQVKGPSLGGHMYRRSLVLWRGGCQPSLHIQVPESRLHQCLFVFLVTWMHNCRWDPLHSSQYQELWCHLNSDWQVTEQMTLAALCMSTEWANSQRQLIQAAKRKKK